MAAPPGGGCGGHGHSGGGAVVCVIWHCDRRLCVSAVFGVPISARPGPRRVVATTWPCFIIFNVELAWPKRGFAGPLTGVLGVGDARLLRLCAGRSATLPGLRTGVLPRCRDGIGWRRGVVMRCGGGSGGVQEKGSLAERFHERSESARASEWSGRARPMVGAARWQGANPGAARRFCADPARPRPAVTGLGLQARTAGATAPAIDGGWVEVVVVGGVNTLRSTTRPAATDPAMPAEGCSLPYV